MNPISQRIHLIPPTTSHTLIFPLNSRSNQFDPGNYAPSLTDNRATYHEIQQVLKSLNHSRQPIFKKEIKVVLIYLVLVFSFTILFFIINAFLIPYSSILLFGVILLFLAFYIISVIFMTKYAQDLKNEAIELAKQVIAESSEKFGEKGLRWNIPKDYPRWVELCNDFKGRQGDQPIYIQPGGETMTIDNVESDDYWEISRVGSEGSMDVLEEDTSYTALQRSQY